MTDQQPETVTVSKEEFEAQKTELEKLKQIFDERQTKALKKEDVLKKDELLKALGIEKDPDKDPVDTLKETISTLTTKISEIETSAKTAREEAETARAISRAQKLAQGYNFTDVEDALKFIDVKSETLEADLKQLAEIKPYLLKQAKSVGGSFAGGKVPDNTNTDIQQELKKYI